MIKIVENKPAFPTRATHKCGAGRSRKCETLKNIFQTFWEIWENLFWDLMNFILKIDLLFDLVGKRFLPWDQYLFGLRLLWVWKCLEVGFADCFCTNCPQTFLASFSQQKLDFLGNGKFSLILRDWNSPFILGVTFPTRGESRGARRYRKAKVSSFKRENNKRKVWMELSFLNVKIC